MQVIFNDLVKLIKTDFQNMELHQVEENIFYELLKLGKATLEKYLSIKGNDKNKYSSVIPYHKQEN